MYIRRLQIHQRPKGVGNICDVLATRCITLGMLKLSGNYRSIIIELGDEVICKGEPIGCRNATLDNSLRKSLRALWGQRLKQNSGIETNAENIPGRGRDNSGLRDLAW